MPTATLPGQLAVDDSLPTRSYRLTAPNTDSTPKVARDMVAALLAATDHPGIMDTARLLVSEIVTNVFRHAAVRLLTVEASVDTASVLVRVIDQAPRHTPPTNGLLPNAAAEQGRGLFLVNALAARWGVSVSGGPAPVNKSVWFLLEDAAST